MVSVDKDADVEAAEEDAAEDVGADEAVDAAPPFTVPVVFTVVVVGVLLCPVHTVGIKFCLYTPTEVLVQSAPASKPVWVQ